MLALWNKEAVVKHLCHSGITPDIYFCDSFPPEA